MSEVLCAPRLTKVKSKFLDEIDARVNWQPISTLLNKKLLKQETDVAGRPAFPPIMLFKALLLGVWYGLQLQKHRISVSQGVRICSRTKGLKNT